MKTSEQPQGIAPPTAQQCRLSADVKKEAGCRVMNSMSRDELMLLNYKFNDVLIYVLVALLLAAMIECWNNGPSQGPISSWLGRGVVH